MLYFYADDTGVDVDTVHQKGLRPQGTGHLCLHTSLQAVQRAGPSVILVVDPLKLATDATKSAGDTVRVPHVPPEALQNVAPYRPPQSVTAAGGYVARVLTGDIILLLIHRRGLWDLPKGTKDQGESIEGCAQREVCEEVGVDHVQLVRGLDTTQHGYPNGKTYAIKTTHWYLMCTSERSFDPDRREGIRRVAWARWQVAYRHLGYDTLRRHMDRVHFDVRTALL